MLRYLSLLILALSIPLFAGDQAKLKQALNQYHNTNYAKALALYDEILKTEPDNIQALIGRVDTLGAMKKMDELVIMRTSKKSGGSDQVLVEAQVYLWEKDMGNAFKTLQQHLAANPNSYMGHYLIGAIYAKSTQGKDKAKDHLSKAIQLNADFPEPYFLLGDLYLKESKSDKVREYWNKYLARIPKEGKRYEYVSNTLSRMGGY